MRREGTRFIAELAASLFVLAAVLAGFAHRPADVPDLRAYALPDGSLPALCTPLGGERPEGPTAMPWACDFCTLLVLAAPPPQTATIELLQGPRGERAPRPRPVRVVAFIDRHPWGPRGPPLG